MSSFSNADTGNKEADPYKAQNENDEISLKEKVADLGGFVDRCKFCMMTTKSPEGNLASRCMALAAREGNGVDFIFHTNTESGKTDDIKGSGDINLGFLNSSGEWASISGTAHIETDREKVRQYYSPSLKLWLGDLQDGKHDGGPEDPRIGLIKIESTTAEYAISKKTMVGSLIESAKSLAGGEAPSLHKMSYISAKEIEQARSGN